MLRDVFSNLLAPDDAVESATIWESSRFAISPNVTDRDPNTRLNPVTYELLLAIIEVGLMTGLSFVVTVFDARMKRILRMADFPVEFIGTPQRIGKATAYAGLLEVSEEAWASVAAKGGINHRVISPETSRPAAAA